MKRYFAALLAIFLTLPAFAFEGNGIGFVGPSQGGTGDTLGRIATTRNYKTTASTGATTQYSLIAATRNQFPNGTTFNTALTTSTLSYGVAQSTVAAAASFTAVTYGPTLCTFDGQTTVGDSVQISTGTAGDCNDTGSTAVPAAGTQLVGYVLTANTGAGTTSKIFALMGSGTQTGFNQSSVKVTNGTSNVSCGKGASNATTVGSATIGPWASDPGTGNIYFKVEGAAAYAIFTAGLTAADIRFSVTCNGSTTVDDHAIPSTNYGATGAGAMFVIPPLGAVGFGNKDINPNGCTVAIACYEGASDTTGAFQIYGASPDSNSVNQTSSWLIKAEQNDQP